MSERHHAPALTCPVGRSARLTAGLAVLWAASASLVFYALFWSSAHGWSAQKAIIMIVFVTGSGLVFWRFWLSQRTRRLSWNGENWLLQSGDDAEVLGQIEVRLDLQRAALLRFKPDAGRAIWCWADAAAAPQHWHLLRCALYSSDAAASREHRDGAPGRA